VDAVLKSITAETRAESPDELTMIASDQGVDRNGSIVRTRGWELENYRKNPVVLWMHRATELPVGRAERVWIHARQLMARIKLAAEGTSPFIDSLRSLVAQDMVRAASVGFNATTEPRLIRDGKTNQVTGIEFDGTELLEISLVNVPLQQRALRQKALDLGILSDFDRVYAPPRPASGLIARRRNELTLLTVRRFGHPLTSKDMP
jgi:hypothetical protein